MGNAKAKRLYEAFLPECFQRPETDQSAEMFIRDKYDKKKYMDKVIDIQMLRVSQHRHTVCKPCTHRNYKWMKSYLLPIFSLQKEKSCDNIPKEPVVFEKMKLVSTTLQDLLSVSYITVMMSRIKLDWTWFCCSKLRQKSQAHWWKRSCCLNRVLFVCCNRKKT